MLYQHEMLNQKQFLVSTENGCTEKDAEPMMVSTSIVPTEVEPT